MLKHRVKDLSRVQGPILMRLNRNPALTTKDCLYGTDTSLC